MTFPSAHANVEDPNRNPVQVGLSDAALRAAIAEYQDGIDGGDESDN